MGPVSSLSGEGSFTVLLEKLRGQVFTLWWTPQPAEVTRGEGLFLMEISGIPAWATLAVGGLFKIRTTTINGPATDCWNIVVSVLAWATILAAAAVTAKFFQSATTRKMPLGFMTPAVELWSSTVVWFYFGRIYGVSDEKWVGFYSFGPFFSLLFGEQVVIGDLKFWEFALFDILRVTFFWVLNRLFYIKSF